MKKKNENQSIVLTSKQFLKKIRIVMDLNHKVGLDEIRRLGKLGLNY